MNVSARNLASLFREDVDKKLEMSVSLSLHTHFRIGGPADFFFQAATVHELMRAVLFARRLGLPHFILGGGYNLLCDDRGYRGLVIKNATAKISHNADSELAIDSGVRIPDLMRYCTDHGIGGLEFLAGIPGTAGGAVFGNAGAFNRDIGRMITGVTVLDPGGDRMRYSQEEMEFGYRTSRLKRDPRVVLEISLRGNPEEPERIETRIRDNLRKRADRHPPMSVACAGSYFKNPLQPDGSKVPAACLLEEIGAKQLMVGGAGVYSRHSNFIINLGTARAEDVRLLAGELKNRVKDRYGIELEEEVIFLSADSPGLPSFPG